MAMENGKRKLDYESLTQTNGKVTRDKKRAKRERPASPDSRDADTEESESDNGVPDFEKEGDAPKESNQTQFSTQRRICLVGSLLLCVFTIFAFAFILPCHHKSCAKDKECGNKPVKHWSKNYSGMTPLVLRDFDDGKYSQGNLLVGYRFPGNVPGSGNTSCPGRHCQGVLSLKGCNGKSLWSSGIDGMLGKVQCIDHAGKKNHFQEGPGCFVQEGKDKMIFIDTMNGNKKWHAEKLGNVRSFRTIPDINGDHFQDILLLNTSPTSRAAHSKRTYTVAKNTLLVLSGKSGKLIGTSVPLAMFLRISEEHVFLRVHRVSASLHYILIGIKPESAKTGTLLAIEVQDLSSRVHNSSITRRKTPWGLNKPNEFGFIELFKETLVLTPPLFADLNKDGVEDVVLCTLDKGVTVHALDGNNAAKIWSRRLTAGESDSALPAIVTLGNHLIDIAVMIKLSNHSSRIVVLNGRNGSVRWLFTLTNPLPVPPVGVPKADGIPQGLLLWLPKSKVNRYLKERDRKYHGNDETEGKKNEKKKRGGPRRKRGLSDVEDDEVVVDDVVRGLLEMLEEGDDGESRDEGEEHVIDDLIDDDGDDGGGDDDDDNDGGGGGDDDDDAGNINDGDTDTGVSHDENDNDADNNDDDNDGSDGNKLSVHGVDDHDDDDDDDSESNGGDIIDGDNDKERNHHQDDKVIVRNDKAKEDGRDVTDVISNLNDKDVRTTDNQENRRTSFMDVQKTGPEDKPYGNNPVEIKPGNPTGHRPYTYDIKPDNPTGYRPYSYNIKPTGFRPYTNVIQSMSTKHSDQTVISEQTRPIDYAALKKFLKNWKANVRLEQQPQATKPTTALPTPRTRIESFKESPNTKETNEKREKIQSSVPLKISPVEVKRTIEVNKTKRQFFSGKQRDKSLLLACDKRAKDVSKELSVVLVYRDEKLHQLRMMEITQDGIISLGPHEYKKQFGKPPPTASCQHFIPNILSKPLVKDIDGDGRLDLIYVLEYINTINPTSTSGYRTQRFMKVKKLDILDAILTRKSKTVKYSRDESKSSKRNERFDSPFAQWNAD